MRKAVVIILALVVASCAPPTIKKVSIVATPTTTPPPTGRIEKEVPQTTITPEPEYCHVIEAHNIRDGIGVEHQKIGEALVGESLPIIARGVADDMGLWYQVQNSVTGWMNSKGCEQ
jgi:hypothetical protein